LMEFQENLHSLMRSLVHQLEPSLICSSAKFRLMEWSGNFYYCYHLEFRFKLCFIKNLIFFIKNFNYFL